MKILYAPYNKEGDTHLNLYNPKESFGKSLSVEQSHLHCECFKRNLRKSQGTKLGIIRSKTQITIVIAKICQ